MTAPEITVEQAQPAPPRTRWAAIVWGLVFAALAGWAFWMLVDGDRRDGIVDWAMGVEPGTIVGIVVLALGALVLVTGLVGLLRHAQRRRARQPRE